MRQFGFSESIKGFAKRKERRSFLLNVASTLSTFSYTTKTASIREDRLHISVQSDAPLKVKRCYIGASVISATYKLLCKLMTLYLIDLAYSIDNYSYTLSEGVALHSFTGFTSSQTAWH